MNRLSRRGRTAAAPGRQPPTDSNGTFSGVSFAVPNVAVGTYSLTVTDAAGKKASVQFTVS